MHGDVTGLTLKEKFVQQAFNTLKFATFFIYIFSFTFAFTSFSMATKKKDIEILFNFIQSLFKYITLPQSIVLNTAAIFSTVDSISPAFTF